VRVLRQLGTCGTVVVLGPLLWLLACAVARALGQHAYDVNITPWTRNHRVVEGVVAVPPGAAPIRDPRVRTELDKYAKVWALEPGACAEFPDAARFPFSFNPFKPSALMLRLKQKQAFLMTQHHAVRRQREPDGSMRYDLTPDPEAALGGRHFVLRMKGNDLLEAYEWR
jgi:hypothetical protein